MCAGNAAVVKPSEVCVHTSKVMEELLNAYLDKVLVSVSSLSPWPSVFHYFFNGFIWRDTLWPPHNNPVQPTLEYGPCSYGYNCKSLPLAMGPLGCGPSLGAPDRIWPSAGQLELAKCIKDNPDVFPSRPAYSKQWGHLTLSADIYSPCVCMSSCPSHWGSWL